MLPLLDSGDQKGVLHYVMPFVDGESLRGVMNRERQLDLEYVLTLTREVADALSYAHRQGVVHRDVKPENVLLSEGHAVVADFGIAKAISTAGGENLTRTGFPIGTPGYMSPEQAAGNTQLDERTDIFSLACIAYEMLTGQTPAWWPTDEEVRLGRFLDAPPDQRTRLDKLPAAVEQALAKAMAARPRDRFSTPVEFAEALSQKSSSPRKYSDSEVRAIVGHAADGQVAHPTEDGALSLGGIEKVAAEVGIAPERIREAAMGMDRPADRPAARRGLFGIAEKIDLERVIGCEVPEHEFEEILENIRGAMGEVGRLNPTLGKSLSWNSLSFQNTIEGAGRLTHVMVSTRGGKTRVRITEGGGQHAALLGGAVATATVVTVGMILGSTIDVLALIPLGGGVIGASYWGARSLLRRLMARRRQFLGDLLDRISVHVAETGSTDRS